MNDDDPNAALFCGDGQEENSLDAAYKHIYEMNPSRVKAFEALWYNRMAETVKEKNLKDDDSKMKLVFSLTMGSILDMLADVMPMGQADDAFSDIDVFTGLALTNMRFGVDLFKEQQKAIGEIKPEDFEDEDAYRKEVSDFEDRWWSISQPALDMRNPNDAIKETMRKYGLQ